MNIVQKRIDEIKPYEKNPRKNDSAVDYVAKSIKEFGFKVPIVIDKDGIIIAGHTRYKASKKLGLKEVPCIIADDLTEEQVKAFRLADNKVGEFADWDFTILDDELFNIEEIDMKEFGFGTDFSDIDWAEVDELTEKTYEEPTHNMLECPQCHHVDRDIHFKKIKGVENTENQNTDE